MVGYIKLHRKIMEWEWYDDANAFRLFIHCLMEANHKDKEWRGITIKRGQFHTSIGTLSSKLRLSDKAVRIALDKLIRTNEVASKGANNGTMITICNYDIYQGEEQEEGQAKGRQKGQSKGERGATTNNDKNDKEIKEDNIIHTPEISIFSFSDFWNAYDKKVGDKTKLEKKYNAISETDRQTIKEHLQNYILSTPEKKYRKNPETYLNNKCWNDEVIFNTNKNGNQKGGGLDTPEEQYELLAAIARGIESGQRIIAERDNNL
jgi:hypothetical protein